MTKNLADQPLSEDDTYERGPLPAKACSCHAAAPMEAIAEPVTVSAPMEAIAEPMAMAASPSCLPYARVDLNPACLAASKRFGKIEDSNKLYDFLRDSMTVQSQEVLMVIMFDIKLYVIGVREMAVGARDRVSVPIPDVLRLPLVYGATSFAIAHNHPSGDPKPSEADEKLTKSILEATDTIQVGLFDHIVMGANSYYSFKANKWKRSGKITTR